MAAPGIARWREEARLDRAARAQIDLNRQDALARLQIADRAARAAERRQDAQAKTAARAQARKTRTARRAARRTARGKWLDAHTVDLLFVPVITVPGVLAWTAMASYGTLLYGLPGLALPAFSEGAMWAFAAATTLTRRQDQDRPVWHLRLGTVLFAAEGAALNFAHGITAAHSIVTGLVYAAVSAAGVTVHQLVTAGPRRSRTQRGLGRLDRLAARRQMAARRAAVRHATAEVDAHGNARLIYRPGPATLTRSRGRARFAPARQRETAPALTPIPAGPVTPWPRPAPVLPGAPGTAPGSTPGTAPGSTPGTAPGRARTRRPAGSRVPGRARAREPVSGEAAEVAFAAALAEGQVPSVRQIKKELHLGHDRALQIHGHLTAVAAAPRGYSRRPAVTTGPASQVPGFSGGTA